MSRFRHPLQTLGASQASGGVNWIVRPRRSRSAWAIPSSRVRSIVILFAPSGAAGVVVSSWSCGGRIVPAAMRPVSLPA